MCEYDTDTFYSSLIRGAPLAKSTAPTIISHKMTRMIMVITSEKIRTLVTRLIKSGTGTALASGISFKGVTLMSGPMSTAPSMSSLTSLTFILRFDISRSFWGYIKSRGLAK